MSKFKRLLIAVYNQERVSCMNQVKHAVNAMLKDYQAIKNTHYSYNKSDKYLVMIDLINGALHRHNVKADEMLDLNIAFNLQCDFISFENWLTVLKYCYRCSIDIDEASFKCRYESPQSGYDCVYLDYQTDEIYLTLFDAE